MTSSRGRIQPEQLYAVARSGSTVILGGDRGSRVPWEHLGRCFLYALRVEDLEACLAEAAQAGYPIVSGSCSDRRGLRGFEVGIGAWGWRGIVACRTADAWGIDVDLPAEVDDPEGRGPGHLDAVEAEVARVQACLRATCTVLLEEASSFRPSAYAWLGSLYERLGVPLEPEGYADPLPADVAEMGRVAHAGGPILHARTSLAPFVTLDRDRAFGSAMLLPVPSGPPCEVTLRGTGLDRWRPLDLVRATGLARATVRVDPGPLVAWLPVHAPGPRFDRARTLYPQGVFQGTWCLSELAALEARSEGRVEALHRVVTFESRPVLGPVIEYLRALSPVLPVAGKRLEHMLYGRWARGLSTTRIGSVSPARPALPRDVFDDRATRRIEGRVEARPYGGAGRLGRARHALVQVHAHLGARVERGVADRPDRAAWITAHNRVELGALVQHLDRVLGPARPGGFVGRVYVDGIDIEARVDQLPPLQGASVRRHGDWMRIYRPGVVTFATPGGATGWDGAGPGVETEADLVASLVRAADPDQGPFAGGRAWRPVPGVLDPRGLPGQVSEPLVIGPGFTEALGF